MLQSRICGSVHSVSALELLRQMSFVIWSRGPSQISSSQAEALQPCFSAFFTCEVPQPQLPSLFLT